MKKLLLLSSALVSILLGTASATEVPGTPGDAALRREQAHKAVQQGNFRDAYDELRKIVLDKSIVPAGQDLSAACMCLQRLGRMAELDEFLESAVRTHEAEPAQWWFLWDVAREYLKIQHQGFLVAGKFVRGTPRGVSGHMVNALLRDRVRALQLMVAALPNALKDNDHPKVSQYLLALANVLQTGAYGASESWRLQMKTDLKVLPDFEEGWGYYGRRGRGAPVDDHGEPVFYQTPKSFEAADSDGQRWRWCLEQAIEFDATRADLVRMMFADFLSQQFGVQTMADGGWRFGRSEIDDSRDEEAGIFALNTLHDDETIARLASGIKRFKLPTEFNFIEIYKKISDDPKSDQCVAATERLAQIFENRRQYPRAADYWRRLLGKDPMQRLFKKFAGHGQEKNWQNRLDQIIGNWGRFEPVMSQAAGQGATVEYRFRNGNSVEFVAHEIKVEKLLGDVKDYIKGRSRTATGPEHLNWEKTNIGDIGMRLIGQNEKQYLGREVASWRMEIKPRPNHFDKRITVSTPLQKAGAYLVRATMANGNTSYIVLWLNDTAIVKKPMDNKQFYFVADATSGAPVPKANVEFFGWRQEWRGPNDIQILVKQFAELTDDDGQLVMDQKTQPSDYQWLATATTKEGRFAYLGFSGVWYREMTNLQFNETKIYPITDRPVYRPGQAVKYKVWVAQAKYDLPEDQSQFAGQSFTVEIFNPKGEKVVSVAKKADAYGGVEGEWKLPADATLGSYGLGIQNLGGNGQFRVEEYKKPEYEVTIDAPKEPVMLGEKISAKIVAKYYFGSPVTNATVRYKVERSSADAQWYPPSPWDWLYGGGYWWFAGDYTWYPGWRSWGCSRPFMPWMPRQTTPPELITDREVAIGPDGTVNVEIETAGAKATHPDQDHRYTITAEVVDQSRRTILGTGEVLVAREPFKVYVWLDRGYYRIGDTIQANLQARRIDSQPVQGKGELSLLRVTYRDGKPVETPVQTWKLDTNEEGQARQQLTASQAGQYRLSYKLTDAAKHTIEGGYVFTIIGEGFDSAQFRFNHLELIPDRANYAPGDKVKLQINTDRVGGTVLLFARPSMGVYTKPTVIHLDGKSTVHEIEVAKGDMPNFFVEAVAVADGRLNCETRDIAVPPEKRILNVEVIPSADSYRPGQKAKVKVKLTDLLGKPFVGSTVLTIYDKSVEYISGGSNVPEIKEFFWKWFRQHNPQNETNLGAWFHNLTLPGQNGMGDLGIFGQMAPEGEGGQSIGSARGGAPGMMRAMAAPEKSAAAPFAAADAAMPMAAAEGLPGPMDMTRANPMILNAMAKAKGPSPDLARPAPGSLVQPTVRSKFADTALWVADLTTQADGTAEVELAMPENLTTWRIKVWGMGHGTKVGQGQADVITRKDLLIRLQSPRFFVQTDEVVLSANVHNYLKSKKEVRVSMELGGKTLEALDKLDRTALIEPNAEARVDWRVKVLDEGEAVIRMKALTDEDSDAMEMKVPCYIHGMLKMDSWSGVIRPKDAAGRFTISVPEKRRPEQSRLEVRYSPTLAGAMVDAMPYMVDYPYGCTEQTLNRFVPTVITQKVLLEMKLNLEEIRKKRTNLNAQEIGDDAQRAAQWKRLNRNPVFDEDEVRRMVKSGVNRLTEMQLSDGGWGWFSGWGEQSTPHTTALVVHGLQMAQRNDAALVPGILERGIEWLRRYQDLQVQRLKNAAVKDKTPGLDWKQHADAIDAFVYMVLVDAGQKNADMTEFLYRDRTTLPVYALAMYGVALEKQGEKDKLAMVLQNINQFVEQDNENQTAWLRMPENSWWYWYGSEYEAEAYYLKLLARTAPKGELASRLVKYLINNRKNATYWNSTRDTAIVIEAMADYLRASGENRPEMTVEVFYDGKLQKAVEITPKTLFQFDNRFVLEGPAVATGKHEVELKRKGDGPLYYNGYLNTFTLEDFITKAGLEIKVQRRYYKLEKVDKAIQVAGSHGQVVDQKVEKYQRHELENLATLTSGDLVEVELEIDSKNDYEYLVFEDMKPAGFETVDVQSGYTGNDLGAYVEYRDNRVVFFTRTLARGKHSVSYRMHAETPGQFSALPTRAWAMYAPELKGNSNEIKLKVKD